MGPPGRSTPRNVNQAESGRAQRASRRLSLHLHQIEPEPSRPTIARDRPQAGTLRVFEECLETSVFQNLWVTRPCVAHETPRRTRAEERAIRFRSCRRLLLNRDASPATHAKRRANDRFRDVPSSALRSPAIRWLQCRINVYQNRIRLSDGN